MRFLPCGDSGLLVELRDLDEMLALYTALDAARPPGVIELVPAARTLLLRLDPVSAVPAEVERAVRATTPVAEQRVDRDCLTVPVVYDGEDLAEVAQLTGLSEREVVDAHTSSEWRVAFSGFAPGFGYLTGGDARLVVPRRSEPRTKVPPGSVALAGEFSGIYPRQSPGGWQLIGRTDLEFWFPDHDPPTFLRPGARIRFETADR